MKNRLLPWVVLLSCCISCKKNGSSSQSPTTPTSVSTDSWKQKASIPNPAPPDGRGIGIGFTIGNFGYMGLGTDNGTDFADLYRYDPAADTWTKMASLDTGLESSVCLVINNKAYAGTGESRLLADYTNHWYEYDPSTNVWTRKADFPGTKRESALGIAIGGKGYVGLGYAPGGKLLYDLWQYDPATDKWSQQANFSDTTACPWYPVAFTLDNITAYVGGSLPGTDVNLVWQYNPVTDHWTQKNNFPGKQMLLSGAFVVNGTGYIMGDGNSNWKYDPAADTWSQVSFFGSRIGGSTFSIGGNGYYCGGTDSAGNPHTDLWQYTP